MTKFTARIAVAGLSALMAITSLGAAQAMPIAQKAPEASNPNIQQVQWRHDHGGWDRHDWHHHRHHGGNAGAIIGGLAAGAIIGGAIESSRPNYYYDRAPYYDRGSYYYHRGPYYYHRGYYYDGY